jgi:cell fate regulator YaaT (PSP1 superfamily)
MSFLREFVPVSIKMAKEQNLPLNPMKISGVCGRLLCCLVYESEQYRTMKAGLPKEGHRLSTAMGVATLVGNNPLKKTELDKLDNQVTMELPLSEINIEGKPSDKEGNGD